MNDIRVSSWAHLQDVLFADSWRASIGRFRSSFAFRGMNRASYPLVTGLTRLGRPSPERERAILRAFQKYAFGVDLPASSVWNWLALAQHHGLPTRLFDWTYSPYVAMHFTTADVDAYSDDGVIWAVDMAQANRLLPLSLQELLDMNDSMVFTSDMLERAAHTLEVFDSLSDDTFVAFFEPPSLDARIVNQYALFSLISNPRHRLDAFLYEHPAVYRRIIVPASLKWEVRDKLDQGNITERVLFPGLDGLTRWLRRYYRDPIWEASALGGLLPPTEPERSDDWTGSLEPR